MGERSERRKCRREKFSETLDAARAGAYQDRGAGLGGRRTPVAHRRSTWLSRRLVRPRSVSVVASLTAAGRTRSTVSRKVAAPARETISRWLDSKT